MDRLLKFSGLRGPLSRRRFLGGMLLGSAGMAVAADKTGGAPQATPMLPALAGQGIRLFERQQWASSKPQLNRIFKSHGFERLTLHHSGSDLHDHTSVGDIARDLDGIMAGHVKRGYGDVGYHYIVDRMGRVWEGRSLRYQGAHVSGSNRANIGLMVLGNYEQSSPTARQVGALYRLVFNLRKHYGISAKHVYGHRDLGASLCPGSRLYLQVPRLRS